MSLAADSSQVEGCKLSRGIRRPRVSFCVADPAGSEGVSPDHNTKDQQDSSSSSSIGQNSDSGDRSVSSDSDEPEVHSGPLHSMDSMEDALPIRRGISNFYAGKSKSFTSLADAATSATAEDLSKPDNPYNRKRKNLIILRSHAWERNRRCSSGEGPASSCIGDSVTFAVDPTIGEQLTPKHSFVYDNKRSFPASRSFSLFDLRAATSSQEEENESGSIPRLDDDEDDA